MTDDLIDRIATGATTLLSADDICVRLSISRSTFDRWVKNGNPTGERSLEDLLQRKTIAAPKKRPLFQTGVKGITEGLMEDFAQYADSAITFPKADIRIGGSPRWDIETLKKWLKSNLNRP